MTRGVLYVLLCILVVIVILVLLFGPLHVHG